MEQRRWGNDAGLLEGVLSGLDLVRDLIREADPRRAGREREGLTRAGFLELRVPLQVVVEGEHEIIVGRGMPYGKSGSMGHRADRAPEMLQGAEGALQPRTAGIPLGQLPKRVGKPPTRDPAPNGGW